MGLLRYQFRSETLSLSVNVTVTYPSERLSPEGREGDGGFGKLFPCRPGMKFQTVYLLHGGSDNQGVPYGEVLSSLCIPYKTLPSIPATTCRTELLRENGFQMQDGIFFVDEEYVVLPYLHVKTLVYEPFNVYRYQVANPEQSTSPKNRGKYYGHREKGLKRLLKEYYHAQAAGCSEDRLQYCHERIRRGVGDHFTTLYIYWDNAKNGRKLAYQWMRYLQQNAPIFWRETRSKAQILRILNLFSISPEQYGKWKARWLIHK